MRKLTDKDMQMIIGSVVAGYKVIKARIKDGKFSDSDNYGIALGENGKGYRATWQFHLRDDDTSYDFYWGHYHMDNKEAAVEDYETRSQ